MQEVPEERRPETAEKLQQLGVVCVNHWHNLNESDFGALLSHTFASCNAG